MEIHPTNKNEVSWTSWMPALGYALAASAGPVLEIGIGHFSTPFLRSYCKGAKRPLSSIEDNLDWFLRFEKARDGDISIHHVPSYKSYLDVISSNMARDGWNIGVAFIDNSPGGEARSKPFSMLLPYCDFIVVHDYHRENEEAIKPLLAGVNYKIFNDYEPPTLLASVKHKL